jgi:DNA-binding transcriptional MerR regulator
MATTTRTTRTTSLARPASLSLEGFARASGLHPDLVVRFVQLGLLDATRDGRGQLRFAPRELRRAERIQRLRTGLSLNYAALGLVLDLLDRIDHLEAALRHRPGPERGTTRSWT